MISQSLGLETKGLCPAAEGFRFNENTEGILSLDYCKLRNIYVIFSGSGGST